MFLLMMFYFDCFLSFDFFEQERALEEVTGLLFYDYSKILVVKLSFYLK